MNTVGSMAPLDPDRPVAWSASFAWSADRHERGLTVRRFRLAFDISSAPQSLLIHVSADSRYRLLLNGHLLGRGPARGTLAHYSVETYELAPALASGRNVLAAEVRWYGENAPHCEEHSNVPGFLVYAPGRSTFDTPGSWRVSPDLSVTPDTTSYHDNAQQFLNHMDRVDFRSSEPSDWTLPDFNDSDWEPARPIGAAVNAGNRWGVADLRVLYPRDIPQLSEEPRHFTRCRTDTGEWKSPPAPWHLAAGMGGSLIFDAGEMTTGYPVLFFQGGRNREVRITYAEAMGQWTVTDGRRVWVKERRDDPTGSPHGYRDTLILSGRGDRFEPFHWRTFWYLKIEILPGADPCELREAHYRRTVFPQTLQAEFDSSDQNAGRFMEVSWRTAQLCAHETYEDCPYYEQQNYIADARLQALTGYYLANETRLARRGLQLFRDSARPDGLIGSRVPSRQPQTIPYFCLLWILMLEDYWLWVGERDAVFVRSCLPVVDGILGFFRERLRPDGFVGRLPHWNMVDVNSHWIRGEPPAVVSGASTFLTCVFIQALESAIRLHEQAGNPEDACRWRRWPGWLRASVHAGAWDAERGLYREGPEPNHHTCSQHTQAAAILADVPGSVDRERTLDRLTSDASLIQANFMPSFYVARALEHAGGYGHFHSKVLAPWRAMLAQGTTTWWEYPNPTRSDCHGWSSWIAADFFSAVLGIKPAAPGWKGILLAPQIAGLDHARGTIATPAGRIAVEWRKTADTLLFKATTPPAVPVEVRLPGASPLKSTTGGSLALSVPLNADTRSATP